VRAELPWFSRSVITRNAIAMSAIALCVGVLAACSSSNSSSSSPSTGASAASGSANKAPIVIGTSLSLAGDFSVDGQAFQKGYNLWAKDVNAKGGLLGRQVTIKVLNDGSQPNQAVTNYQTLINTDHVDLTFGPFSSLLTGPSSSVAARNGYAFIEGAGGAPSVFNTPSNQADHNVFDVSMPVADYMLPFVNYIASLPAGQR
jgi:branched-chain amino acid transport system substrate-binding protein